MPVDFGRASKCHNCVEGGGSLPGRNSAGENELTACTAESKVSWHAAGAEEAAQGADRDGSGGGDKRRMTREATVDGWQMGAKAAADAAAELSQWLVGGPPTAAMTRRKPTLSLMYGPTKGPSRA